MKVEVPALEQDRLATRYAADGRAFSPPVRWRDTPGEARELALILESVRHSGEREFTHWIAWGIDPGWGELEEGLMSKPEPDAPEGLRQGAADSGKTGYAALVGVINRPQRLGLRLFALDAPLELEPGAGVEAFDRALQGHVLDEAEHRFEYRRRE